MIYGPISSMFRPPVVSPVSGIGSYAASAIQSSMPTLAGGIAGAALAGVAGAMYMNRTHRPKPVEIGPRDWSPRTGKCLCKKHWKSHGLSSS